MYTLDMSSAYRYVALQLLDLWHHCFLWLDADGHVGVATDARLCFGGAYGPNRFQRLTTLITALIERRLAAFDATHPYPTEVAIWASERRELVDHGFLPGGAGQLVPRSIQVYLDDVAGAAGLDQVEAPPDCPMLTLRVDEATALGLVCARSAAGC